MRSAVEYVLPIAHTLSIQPVGSAQGGRTCDVVGTDGQVCHLQALGAVDIQARIQHSVLNDLVAFPWSHLLPL